MLFPLCVFSLRTFASFAVKPNRKGRNERKEKCKGEKHKKSLSKNERDFY